MQRSLHSNRNVQSAARSLGAPPLFSAFSKELQVRLQGLAVRRKFTGDQIIQQSGDKASGFWVIEQGQVKIGRYGEGGRFQVLVIFGAGDSYGELGVFGGSPRVVDAVAVGDVTLKWITAKQMDRVIEEEPAVARELLSILSKQLQEALTTLIASRRLSAGELLARALVTLCRENNMQRNINLNQEDLAELVGTSRMTVSKALSKMAAHGLIRRHYGRLEICDVEGLENY